jgi:pyrroloquinoline-quinone synthase
MNTRASELLAALDGKIEQFHLLKHPFYQAWTAGTLSRKALALYAAQYYQQVQAFPRYLQTLSERADGPLRTIVDENLREELQPSAPHPLLWRNFAAALNVDEVALESAQPLPGIAALVETYEDLSAHASTTEAVAALYAYESQVPEIATQKRAGLTRFYGIFEPRDVAYFTVHEEADVRHRAAWRAWLAAQPDVDSEKVLTAAERGLRALWAALDAVYPEGCGKN